MNKFDKLFRFCELFIMFVFESCDRESLFSTIWFTLPKFYYLLRWFPLSDDSSILMIFFYECLISYLIFSVIKEFLKNTFMFLKLFTIFTTLNSLLIFAFPLLKSLFNFWYFVHLEQNIPSNGAKNKSTLSNFLRTISLLF